MNIHQNGELIKTIRVLPQNTILQIKQSIPSYENSVVKLVFSDGTEIASVVFSANTYDNVDLKQYGKVLNGSNLYITSVVSSEPTEVDKDLENDVKSPKFSKLTRSKPGTKPLTGNKNVDMLILSQMDDRSLLNTCLVKNKYINGLCNDNNFWRNRFVTKFGLHASEYKPKGRSWRRHYLKVISDLDEVYPLAIFDKIEGRLENLKRSADDGNKDETNQNIYWLLDLGNSIKIGYPTDRYQELEPVVREYKSDTHFTPAQVIGLIQDFYNEPVSPEELRIQQEVDNPYAEDYTARDAELGKIKRVDLIPMFFEGFSQDDGVWYINLGS